MTDLSIDTILKHLPHRYPFLFIDKVVSIEKGKKIHAQKNVSINEPFFQGHFPNKPVMPGVLILKAMAQASGILGFMTMEKTPDDGSIYYFVFSSVFVVCMHPAYAMVSGTKRSTCMSC